MTYKIRIKPRYLGGTYTIRDEKGIIRVLDTSFSQEKLQEAWDSGSFREYLERVPVESELPCTLCGGLPCSCATPEQEEPTPKKRVRKYKGVLPKEEDGTR